MVDIKSFIKPSGMKILLGFLLLVPSLMLSAFIISLIIGFENFGFILVFGIIVAYLIASLLDTLIKSKPVKIIIAVVSTLISFWLLSKFLMGSVSEYAHVPSECELACRDNIMKNVTNATEATRQKFYECLGACFKK